MLDDLTGQETYGRRVLCREHQEAYGKSKIEPKAMTMRNNTIFCLR